MEEKENLSVGEEAAESEAKEDNKAEHELRTPEQQSSEQHISVQDEAVIEPASESVTEETAKVTAELAHEPNEEKTIIFDLGLDPLDELPKLAKDEEPNEVRTAADNYSEQCDEFYSSAQEYAETAEEESRHPEISDEAVADGENPQLKAQTIYLQPVLQNGQLVYIPVVNPKPVVLPVGAQPENTAVGNIPAVKYSIISQPDSVSAAQKPKKEQLKTGVKVYLIIMLVLTLAGLGLAIFAMADISHKGRDYSRYYEYFESKEGHDSTPSGSEGETSPVPTEQPEEKQSTPAPKAEEYTQPDIEYEHIIDGIKIQPKPNSTELSAVEVYEKVLPSTVTVTAKIPLSDGSYSDSMGSGIFISEDGFILTNSHVIGNTKSAYLSCTTSDGTVHECIAEGFDKTSDLAILKIDGSGYIPAEIGSAEELSIGEWVIAVGTPGSTGFSGSLTRGVVSGLDRTVGSYSSNGMTYIQTDAAINPGNSGGPLVNMYGQVVGITSSKIVAEHFEGMGFAIPISKAEEIIEELLSKGYVNGRVRLGITAATLSYGSIGLGVEIISIDDDSAFKGTDAKAGDIIIKIGDTDVTNMTALSNALLLYQAGDEVDVVLVRFDDSDTESEEFTVRIKLISDEGQTQR